MARTSCGFEAVLLTIERFGPAADAPARFCSQVMNLDPQPREAEVCSWAWAVPRVWALRQPVKGNYLTLRVILRGLSSFL